MPNNLQQEPQGIPHGLIIVYNTDGPPLDLAHASIPKALAAICSTLSEAAQGSIDPDQPPAGGRARAFAGRCDFRWLGATVARTFAIGTANANETVGELHDRMPVILEPEDWPTWLGEVERDPATLLRPAGDDVLKVWPVSKQVNSPRNNGAESLEKIG
jgi:putative SOS response-associated peptidase YedK